MDSRQPVRFTLRPSRATTSDSFSTSTARAVLATLNCQTPTGFHYVREIPKLKTFPKPEQFVGQSDATAVLALVREEPDRNLVMVNDVEGVDYVVEAQLCSLSDQFVFADFSRCEFAAAIQKTA